MLKKTNQKGFTIVELLIVIVVIGILAALVISTFSGVQARARDAQRQTDVKAIATQLEVYHTDNGGYPLANGVTTANLKGLDPGAIAPPTGSATAVAAKSTTTAPAVTDVKPTSGNEVYLYWPRSGASSTCSSAPCQSFTLYYWDEQNNTVKSVTSLN